MPLSRWSRATQRKTNVGCNPRVPWGIVRCSNLPKPPLLFRGRSGLLWRVSSGLLQPPRITSRSLHSPVPRKAPTQKGGGIPRTRQTSSDSRDDSPCHLIRSLVGGVGCAPVPIFFLPPNDGLALRWLCPPFLSFPPQVWNANPQPRRYPACVPPSSPVCLCVSPSHSPQTGIVLSPEVPNRT